MAPKLRTLESGAMRHIGNIERLKTDMTGEAFIDSVGTPEMGFEVWAANVRFAIDDWKPFDAFIADQVEASLSTRIRIRYRLGLEGLAPGAMRIAHITNPGKWPLVTDYYEIVGAVRDPNLRFDLTLICTRRSDPGFRVGETP